MDRESRDTWAKRVERWEESGLMAKEYVTELGINAHSPVRCCSASVTKRGGFRSPVFLLPAYPLHHLLAARQYRSTLCAAGMRARARCALQVDLRCRDGLIPVADVDDLEAFGGE